MISEHDILEADGRDWGVHSQGGLPLSNWTVMEIFIDCFMSIWWGFDRYQGVDMMLEDMVQ